MSQQIKYWEAIIDEYKTSGLSQPAFCKQNGLSSNQFQYRWYQHNLAKRTKARPLPLENNASASSFESVSITTMSAHLADEPYTAELTIHFPNKIRCDVKVNLRAHAFATLLKQLVVLC